jgi:hypothetical protein
MGAGQWCPFDESNCFILKPVLSSIFVFLPLLATLEVFAFEKSHPFSNWLCFCARVNGPVWLSFWDRAVLMNSDMTTNGYTYPVVDL